MPSSDSGYLRGDSVPQANLSSSSGNRTQKIFFVRVLCEALLIILVAAVPAGFAWSRLTQHDQELLPYEITSNDSRLSGEIVWVDARSREEYAVEHAAEAVLLNELEWDTLVADLFEKWSPDRLIVVYCDAGCHASHAVAERLRDMGIEPVFVLKGGLAAYKQRYPEAANR